jgi:hypothetical protein
MAAFLKNSSCFGGTLEKIRQEEVVTETIQSPGSQKILRVSAVVK